MSAVLNIFEADLVLDAHAGLGEGPLWDNDGNRLIWLDIPNHEVHLFSPDSGNDRVINVSPAITSVVMRRDGGAVVANTDGFAWFDLETGQLDRIPDTGICGVAMNDGECDPAGRFWAGSCASGEGADGALYRLNADLTVDTLFAGVGISNGTCWSLDWARMYYIDSPTQQVDQFAYDAATGAIRDREMLIAIPASSGLPDGMTIDAEGCLWVAIFNGGVVQRYRPDGSLAAEVRVPASQVTSCAFGGPDLCDLFVTTAAAGLTPEQAKEQPHAGGLFCCRPGVAGLAPYLFGGLPA